MDVWLGPGDHFPACFALARTSNSLMVPIHVHPSLGQTAAKASTSLRAALSGKACVEKQRLLSAVIWSLCSVTAWKLALQTLCLIPPAIKIPGAHFSLLAPVSYGHLTTVAPSTVYAAKSYRAVKNFSLWLHTLKTNNDYNVATLNYFEGLWCLLLLPATQKYQTWTKHS